MLTPDKVKEKQFQSSGRGAYRADDVDAFMNEVSASYEQMFKENGDLIRKISILAKKVEEYRADEENLKLALLNAQKLADQIVSEAKQKAEGEYAEAVAAAEKKIADANTQAEELSANSKRESTAIIESAKAEAEKIVADANKQSSDVLGNMNRQVTHETLVYEMTKKEASEFKAKLVAMYKEHINLINQLPEIVDEQLAPEKAEITEEPAKEETKAEPEVVIPEAEELTAEQETEETPAEVVCEKAETPEFEDVYSDSADDAETPEESVKEEPAKSANPFKLDLSKIDFSDDYDDEGEEPQAAPTVFEKLEDDDDSSDGDFDSDDNNDEDGGSGSISFKNFFKKK